MYDLARYVTAPDLGKRITHLREQQGLTKASLARILRVSNVTISNWEEGAVDAMNWRNLVALADTLQVPLDKLIDAEGGPTISS